MYKEKALKKNLISVVMSNYNTPINYLKESIDSVLNQSYSDFEFIIIDDGSTDDSLEFIKSYDDPRIKLVINKENIGLTKSLNKGFDLAQGEYIARMDADDICYPTRFEKQVKYMQGHPSTIVCGAWAKILDDDNTLSIAEWACSRIDDMEEYRINLLFNCYPPFFHSSAFFNHGLLIKYDIKYNEKYRYAQDYELWTRCSQYAKSFIIQEFLLEYRSHSASISKAKRDAQRNCVFQIVQDQLDHLHLKLPDDVKDAHVIFPTRHAQYNAMFKKWIKKMIRANRMYKIYNQRKMNHLLWYYWSKVCYAELSHSNVTRRLRLIISLSPRCIINLFKIKKYYIVKRKHK